MTLDLDAVLARLAGPTAPPLPGQQAICVATVWDHPYQGPGDCKVDLFGTLCGAHRDEHKHDGEGGQR
ncbi:hypothetical protein ACFV0T_26360 [Streptomyces sp. NPDC059582]|uniref:hypothetical protein n=1 Tax=Streptomyces sp. NPDC059582 TaxID=3346875 RepID=UPI0036CB4A52